ncbi:CHAT domain-containing protein [Sorangium sp. So ce834]|uniref:CHAT domain-containing protein n=1 Tax=Sorangium sp. So ce834 TaxID=3133321 RepID=UPI003F63B3D1
MAAALVASCHAPAPPPSSVAGTSARVPLRAFASADSWFQMGRALASWVHYNVQPAALAPGREGRLEILSDCAMLTGAIADAVDRLRPRTGDGTLGDTLRRVAQRCQHADPERWQRVAEELVETANHISGDAPEVAAPLLLLGTRLGAGLPGSGGPRGETPELALRAATLAYLETAPEPAGQRAWLLSRLYQAGMGIARAAEAPRAARVAYELSRLDEERLGRLREFRERLSDDPSLFFSDDLTSLAREAEALHDDVMASALRYMALTLTAEAEVDWRAAQDGIRMLLENGLIEMAAAALLTAATSQMETADADRSSASFLALAREVERRAARLPTWRGALSSARVSELVFLLAVDERPERYCTLWNEEDMRALSFEPAARSLSVVLRILAIPCITTTSSHEATRLVDRILDEAEELDVWMRRNGGLLAMATRSTPPPQGQMQVFAAYLASHHLATIGHVDASRVYARRAQDLAKQHGLPLDAGPPLRGMLIDMLSGQTLFDTRGETLLSDDLLQAFRAPSPIASGSDLDKAIAQAALQLLMGPKDDWRTLESLLQSAERAVQPQAWPRAQRASAKLLRACVQLVRTGQTGAMRTLLREMDAALSVLEAEHSPLLAFVASQGFFVLTQHPLGKVTATALARRMIAVDIERSPASENIMLDWLMLLPRLRVIEADRDLPAARQLAEQMISRVNSALGSFIGTPSQIKAYQLWKVPLEAIAEAVIGLDVRPEQELARRRLALRLHDLTQARSLTRRLHQPADAAAAGVEARSRQIEQALLDLDLAPTPPGVGPREHHESARARLMHELAALKGLPAAGQQALLPLADGDIDELFATLGPRERLVLLHRDREHLTLFVLSRGGRLDMQSAPIAADLVDRIDLALKQISDPCSKTEALPRSTTFALLQELYRTLVLPLEESGAISPGDSLVFAGDDELTAIPAALWIRREERGRPEYLVESYTVSGAPSASAWLASARKWRNKAFQGRGQVFAVSRYEGARLPFGRGGSTFVPADLPGTRDEGKATQRALERIVPELSVTLDREATTQAFLKAARSGPLDVLHVAAHGLGGPTIKAPAGQGGLLLSGRGRDGFLPMIEILAEQLNARAVVLSACDGGVGRGVSGEGALSLGWAFLASGAEAVVVSRWPLADRPIHRLMQGFYEAAAAGASPASALAAAQRKLLDEPLPEAVACRTLGQPVTLEQLSHPSPPRAAPAARRWRDYPGMWGGLVLIGHDPARWLVPHAGAPVKDRADAQ